MMLPSLIGLLHLCLALAVAGTSAAALPRSPSQRRAERKALEKLLKLEIEAWKESGYESIVQFPGKRADDEPVWASITEMVSLSFSKEEGRQNSWWETVLLDSEYEDGVVFHIYTERNDTDINGVILQNVTFDKQEILDAGWDAAKATKVIVHGFNSDITSDMIQDIKNAYLQDVRQEGPFNVLAVDWGVLCRAPFYVSARLHVWGTGQRLAELLNFLISNDLAEPHRMHIIGHSLGAHVVGIAGKFVETGPVARVTGLDPAMPLFLLTPDSERLNATDAKVVDVIHTCAGRLGFLSDLGTSDFFPNGGEVQPGCGLDIFGICAHCRSYHYFAESIRDGGFLAYACPRYDKFRNGLCANNTKGYMGDETSKEGLYYLKTRSAFPYQLNGTGYFDPGANGW